MIGKKNYFLYLLVGLLEFSTSAIAQQNNTSSKMYQKALDAFNEKNFSTSIKILETEIEKNQNNIEAQVFLFQVYTEAKQFQKSINTFEKLISIDTSVLLPFIVKYATAYAIMGNYSKAAAIIEDFQQKNLLPSYLKTKASELLLICDFAKNHPAEKEIKVENIGDSVNTADAEYFPSITVQDSLFLFMRRTNFKREDFYFSILKKNIFSKEALKRFVYHFYKIF